MKFKKDVESVATDNFWYDLTDGGYIKPEKFLEEEDAKKVNEAVDLLREFLSGMEENEFLEYM